MNFGLLFLVLLPGLALATEYTFDSDTEGWQSFRDGWRWSDKASEDTVFPGSNDGFVLLDLNGGSDELFLSGISMPSGGSVSVTFFGRSPWLGGSTFYVQKSHDGMDDATTISDLSDYISPSSYQWVTVKVPLDADPENFFLGFFCYNTQQANPGSYFQGCSIDSITLVDNSETSSVSPPTTSEVVITTKPNVPTTSSPIETTTVEPDATTTEEAETFTPDVPTTAEPDATTTEEAETFTPEVPTTAEPDVTTTEEAETFTPEVPTTTEPDATTTEEAVTSTPDVPTTAEPDATTTEEAETFTPDVPTTAEPDATTTEEAITSTPDIPTTAEPEATTTEEAETFTPDVTTTAEPDATTTEEVVTSTPDIPTTVISTTEDVVYTTTTSAPTTVFSGEYNYDFQSGTQGWTFSHMNGAAWMRVNTEDDNTITVGAPSAGPYVIEVISQELYSGTVIAQSPLYTSVDSRLEVNIKFWLKGSREYPTQLKVRKSVSFQDFDVEPIVNLDPYGDQSNPAYLQYKGFIDGVTAGDHFTLIIEGNLGANPSNKVVVSEITVVGVQEKDLPNSDIYDFENGVTGWLPGNMDGGRWVVKGWAGDGEELGIPQPESGDKFLFVERFDIHSGVISIESPKFRVIPGTTKEVNLKFWTRGSVIYPAAIRLRLKDTDGEYSELPFLNLEEYGDADHLSWVSLENAYPISITEVGLYQIIIEADLGSDVDNLVAVDDLELITSVKNQQ